MFLRGSVSQVQMQGPRTSHEDRVVHVPFKSRRNGRGHLLGVMDGHAGKGVAEYCATNIPRLFNPDTRNIKEEFETLVARLDAGTRDARAGSTLSLAHISESRGIVTLAVLGDSPIIVVDSAGATHLSEEHNARTNKFEREAAIGRGAIYQDGYLCKVRNGEGLQMSRALGDCRLRALLDRTPAISSHRINSRSVVLVASDGLFDPFHAHEPAEAVQSILAVIQSGGDAAAVLRWREEKELQDNTSLIIWKPKSWWKWF